VINLTRIKDTLLARRLSWPNMPAKMGAHLPEDPARSMARTSWAAYGACALAFAYAGVSLYWALGGTGGLNTVGGFAERAARSPGRAALTLIWATVVVKVLGGLLALSLVRPWGASVPRRLVLLAGTAASALLIMYGGVLVIAAVLVETGVVRPGTPIDWRGFRWHLGLWDLWFLIWGVLLGIAVWRFHRDGGSAATLSNPAPSSPLRGS
jgi:hypothetical protein